MKKTRARIESLLLALALVLTLLPVTALAEGDDDTSKRNSAVAQIGKTSYETLADAIAAVPLNTQTTVKLISDFQQDAEALIPEGKKVVLDLNGCAVTVPEAGSNGSSLYVLSNYGTLTVTDSSSGRNGSITARGIKNYGTMYMEAGTIDSCDSNGGGAAIWNEDTLYVNGGTLKTSGERSGTNAASAIVNNGGYVTIIDGDFPCTYHALINQNGGTANIEGGTFSTSAEDYAYTITNNEDCTMTISNAKVEANGGALGANTGKLTINSGEFRAEKWYALWVTNDGVHTDVTVNGGSFYGNAYGLYASVDDDGQDVSDVHIRINGGSFSGGTAAALGERFSNNTWSLSITGGTFSSDVSEYVADGYEIVPQGDQWVVGTLDDLAVAQVGDQKYASLSEAINAVQDGGTVTLIRDSVLLKPIQITNQTFILDMNGKTMSLGATDTEGGTIIFSGNSNVTITGNGTVDFNDSYLTGESSGRMFEVDGTATLTIENGTFEGGLVCVLADENATVRIMDGNYSTIAKSYGKYWVLNKQDNSEATFLVYGGTFKNYDPANSDTENPADNFCAPDYVSVKDGDYYTVMSMEEAAVAQIGDTYYLTLAEAIEAADNSAVIQVLKDIPNAVGIAVASGKNFTIDFGGHTYTLTGPGAGSTNTETNGFQLLEGSTITLKNGTIRIAENANNIKRIIQNYADLTLEDMQFYAENQVGGEDYALSFNNGNTTFKGNTSVYTSSSNTIAFDICKFGNYPGVTVTFDESYTGTINGRIVYDSPNAETHKLIIKGNGSFGGIDISSTSTNTPNISITGGYFTSDPVDYVASGYAVDVSDKTGYTYKVIEAGENTTVTKPAVEAPHVEMGSIAEADQKAVEEAVEKTDVAEITAAAVAQANKLSESSKNAAANQLKGEIEVEEGAVITIFVQTYLDIKPTVYDKSEKIFTLDITPMYQLVASTAAKAENVELGKNAVEYGDPKELTISGETTVSIPLPTGFLSGSQNVYVKHSKDGRFVAYHEATIKNNVLTFVNDKGFSTFEITEDTRSATVKFGTEKLKYTPVNVGDALPTATAPSGQRFVGWTFEGITGTYTTLTNDLLTALAKKEGTITATASFADVSSGDSDSSDVSGDYIVSVDQVTGGKVVVRPGRADKGDEVTITAIPNDGYVLQSLTVTDKDGDTVRVSDEGNDKYTFTMPGSAVTVKAVFAPEGSAVVIPEVSFTDVAESYWAYNEIRWAAENGYMTGTTATTFNPGGTVTRQQVWMILARMAGARPADMAAAKTWAVNNGISDGTNPGGAVTRQQLVALLYRFAGQYGYNVSNKADLSGYPDVASLASYAAEPMAWSVAGGIIGGTTQGTLNPAGTATRAQFAVILWRFYQTTAA